VRRADQIPEEDRDREQAEAGDEQAGDRTGAERHGQAALQAGAGRLRGADVGLHRHVHADEAGQARQECAGDEADSGNEAEEIADQRRDDHADDGDRPVLAGEIGARAFLDRFGDGDHPLVAGRGAQHLHRSDDAVKHGDKAAAYGDEHDGHETSFPCD